MEALQARHRKEQRDLQALITQKKKSASKKMRKGVNDECARLEEELKQKQEAERVALNGDANVATGDDEEKQEINGDDVKDTAEAVEANNTGAVTNGVAALAVSEDGSQGRGKKPNRQKARLARRAAEREEAVAQADEEAQSMPDLRAKEQETMDAAIQARGLKMHEIRADGHCLYSAVADQLSGADVSLQPSIRPTIMEGEEPYRTVRRTAATYITKNKDEFEPFLDEPLDDYVSKVGETGEWGGQLELLALAKAYGVNIGVLDGNGQVHEVQGAETDEEEAKKIWLAYYRHGFGLGEHYNSLRKG